MFLETPRFPEGISIGATGGPGFKTDIGSTPNGNETSDATRSISRHEYDVAHGLKTHDQYLQLKAFFMAMFGKWGKFRYKDWSDYQIILATTGPQAQGVGIFVSPGVYQLNARYTNGSITVDRPLYKPVSATILVQRNASTVTQGVAAGNCVVGYTTGLVTFVADQTKTVSTVTVGTTTNVTLSSAFTGTPTELTLSGLGGADAALLNGNTFSITGIAGAVYTLSVNTAGKTITASGGSARLYPVAGDVMTASGEFDVPCRFDTDKMLASIDDYNIHSWGQIPVLEVTNLA